MMCDHSVVTVSRAHRSTHHYAIDTQAGSTYTAVPSEMFHISWDAHRQNPHCMYQLLGQLISFCGFHSKSKIDRFASGFYYLTSCFFIANFLGSVNMIDDIIAQS